MEKTLKPAGTASAGRTKRLVMTALFAALGCAATMVVKVPSPTGGYMNLGDTAVLLGAYCLGPVYGAAAGGVGPAMADLLGGYFIYVPITFVIKGAVAFAAGLIYQKIGKTAKSRGAAVVLGGIADIVLVAGGYFLCESMMYGVAAAAASVPANIIQGISGLVIGALLYPVLLTVPDIRRIAHEAKAYS